jgi:orotate phosphoribosyltransferase
MRDTLFVRKDFVMHSGGSAFYKIECDALTDDDIETLAWIVAQKGKFSKVVGVPNGGIRFALALQKYVSQEGPTLIVDDVLTTGFSMEEAKNKIGDPRAIGIVIFARKQPADWIRALFTMTFF